MDLFLERDRGAASSMANANDEHREADGLTRRSAPNEFSWQMCAAIFTVACTLLAWAALMRTYD